MTSFFVNTPQTITLADIVGKEYSLSPAQYRSLNIKNSNTKLVRDFLDRPLNRADLGEEVGSSNYIEASPYRFIKTKALQAHSFIPDMDGESSVPIMPSSFNDMHLHKGDLIISKDSNIGEAAILDKDYPKSMLSGAIYRLPISTHKFYLFAFIKHPLFREQIDFLTPKGATIRHCKTLFLDCKIPLPNYNPEQTIRYVEILTRAIIEKQSKIVERHRQIISCIKYELEANQGEGVFNYKLPSISEVEDIGRLDSKMYTESFKQEIFKVQNYRGGCETIDSLGFVMSRGQNLQVSNIGDSVYSEKPYKGFYKLMLPKFLSRFGTAEKVEYLGNPKPLKTLKVGDIIFGAEGFEKGRSIVIIEPEDRTITNIHGITLQQKGTGNLTKAIFVKCFLDYLRSRKLIDSFAVGGNGGSMAKRYWGYIPFPRINDCMQKTIGSLYFNDKLDYAAEKMSLDEFEAFDREFNNTAGIYELDKTAKLLMRHLNEALFAITNDEHVMPFFL